MEEAEAPVIPEVFPVDVSNDTVDLWLVKIPTIVAKAWNNDQIVPGTELGKIIISATDGGAKVTAEITELPDGMDGHCNLTMTNGRYPLKAFSQDLDEGVTIHGKIKHKFQLQAVNNTAFTSAIRTESNNHTNLNKESIRVINHAKPKTIAEMRAKGGGMTIKPHVEEFLSTRKRSRAESMTPAGARLSKEEIMERIFEMFSEHANWTLKQINHSLGSQPHALVRECLNEICILHKTGKNKSTYELKPEYKSSKRARI
eukprot:TRINITY_DN373_c1_g1_i1.p1 TRINITY_DN373_c1_g1~~TRINITY_DN373_c1_g1_i1.p1  ORF type:complete len:258 (+),score=66.21 TRINITY_DN373_c1_g1_i1:24-797(+)